MKWRDIRVYLAFIFAFVFSSSSFAAAGTELSSLASNISFVDLILALTTLFGAMASVGVILKGGAIVLAKLNMR